MSKNLIDKRLCKSCDFGDKDNLIKTKEGTVICPCLLKIETNNPKACRFPITPWDLWKLKYMYALVERK